MNSWTITGRLGRDAEVKAFNNGNKVANLNVAIDERKKNANGEYESNTLWVSAHLSNPSEKLLPYLKKGAMLLLQGRPSASSYRNKEGKDIIAMEMRVDRLELFSSVKTEGAPANTNQADDDLPFA